MRQGQEDLPGVDAPIRARALGFLFLAGAAIGTISMVLPHSAQADEFALWTNIGVAAAGGVALWAFGQRLPTGAFHVLVALGAVLVTRAVLESGEQESFYTVWFLWIGLYAFYFFRRLEAIAHITFVAALYGATLIQQDTNSPLARWLTTMTTLLVAGIFIDTLVRRARGQADTAAETAVSLATVAEVAHELARLSDSVGARPAVCSAAARVTRADTVALWEPAADGTGLWLSAAARRAPTQKKLPFVAAPSGAARAFTTGERVVSGKREAVPEFLGAGHSPAACLWQPIMRDDVPVAVLAFYWRDPLASEAPLTLGSLLAAEVAVTLSRVDLLSRLESIARTDDLTGLPNRRSWEEELPREVSRSTREGRPLCVAMIDLDFFKKFNDENGHQAGDRLLKQAAGAWAGELRATDFLARYGGEEFALALPACPPDEARVVVERLRAATPGAQTVSAGIAFWDGMESADALIGRADDALYEAKRSGRNRALMLD
jgi:diguanylate cyclase (GGDEF)-like protein